MSPSSAERVTDPVAGGASPTGIGLSAMPVHDAQAPDHELPLVDHFVVDGSNPQRKWAPARLGGIVLLGLGMGSVTFIARNHWVISDNSMPQASRPDVPPEVVMPGHSIAVPEEPVLPEKPIAPPVVSNFPAPHISTPPTHTVSAHAVRPTKKITIIVETNEPVRD